MTPRDLYNRAITVELGPYAPDLRRCVRDARQVLSVAFDRGTGITQAAARLEYVLREWDVLNS